MLHNVCLLLFSYQRFFDFFLDSLFIFANFLDQRAQFAHFFGFLVLQTSNVIFLLDAVVNHLLGLGPGFIDTAKGFVFFQLENLDTVVELADFNFSVKTHFAGID